MLTLPILIHLICFLQKKSSGADGRGETGAHHTHEEDGEWDGAGVWDEGQGEDEQIDWTWGWCE